jgi:hypothetical protein
MSKTARKATTNEKTPLELAQATLSALEQKRAKVVAKRDQDDREAAAISYQALAGGDKEATDKLDAINERAMKCEIEIKNLDAAIATARVKVEEAKAAEAAEAERLAATELLGLAKVLREAGQKADDALAVLNEAAQELGDVVTAINHLGVTHPSAAHLMSLGERAIKTALIGQPWSRGFEHLPPSERRDFAGFTSEWSRKLESEIEQKLEQLNQH